MEHFAIGEPSSLSCDPGAASADPVSRITSRFGSSPGSPSMRSYVSDEHTETVQTVLAQWKNDMLDDMATRQSECIAQAIQALSGRHAEALHEMRLSAPEDKGQEKEAMLLKASLYDLRHQIQDQGCRLAGVTRDVSTLLDAMKQQDTQHADDMQNLRNQVQVLHDHVSNMTGVCARNESTLKSIRSEMVRELAPLQDIQEGLTNQQSRFQWLQNDLEEFRGRNTQFLESELRAIHNEIANLQSNGLSRPEAATGMQSEGDSQPLASPAASELQRHAESRAEVILLSFREMQERERRLAEQKNQRHSEATVPCHDSVDGEQSGRRSERLQAHTWKYEHSRSNEPQQRPCEQKSGRCLQDEQARRPFAQSRVSRPSGGVMSTTRSRQEYQAAVTLERNKLDVQSRFLMASTATGRHSSPESRNRSSSPGAKRAASPRVKQPSPGPKRPFAAAAPGQAGAGKTSPTRRFGSRPSSPGPRQSQ